MKENKPLQYIECTIEKLVFGGQALAHVDGATAFIWNALPGEVVKARILKKRKGIIEAEAVEILKPSKDRIAPIDEHYLSCSPWQIMTREAEEKNKVDIAKETFSKLGGFDVGDCELVVGDSNLGYRNKMEYSFFQDASGQIHLALFIRGGKAPRPIEPCALASDSLNKVAVQILEWIRLQRISRFDLKTLIVRTNRKGEAIAVLFSKTKGLRFSSLPELNETLKGFQLYYSYPKSPASIPTELMKSVGASELEETLLGATLKYGALSFFQINPPVFEKTLLKIGEFIGEGGSVVDFYSGVGAISIPLKDKIKEAILVDSNEEGIEFAKQNILNNDCQGYKAEVAMSEKALSHVTSQTSHVLLDPPRAGLHPDVTAHLLEVLPEKIVYLSCNISTQARDLKMLLTKYELVDLTLYDYFPRTPHFESLALLKKITNDK